MKALFCQRFYLFSFSVMCVSNVDFMSEVTPKYVSSVVDVRLLFNELYVNASYNSFMFYI